MSDAYAQAVEYFLANRGKIGDAWYDGYFWRGGEERGSFLFQGLGPSGSTECPCPAACRMTSELHYRERLHPELLGVVNDDRINFPVRSRRTLEAIAEWQRKADEIHNREAPVFV